MKKIKCKIQIGEEVHEIFVEAKKEEIEILVLERLHSFEKTDLVDLLLVLYTRDQSLEEYIESFDRYLEENYKVEPTISYEVVDNKTVNEDVSTVVPSTTPVVNSDPDTPKTYYTDQLPTDDLDDALEEKERIEIMRNKMSKDTDKHFVIVKTQDKELHTPNSRNLCTFNMAVLEDVDCKYLKKVKEGNGFSYQCSLFKESLKEDLGEVLRCETCRNSIIRGGQEPLNYSSINKL